MPSSNATTRVPPKDPGSSAEAPVLALTILVHPDLRRIGERALLVEMLQGEPAEVGRNVPDFAPPGRHLGEPLEDAFLSREPVLLVPRGEAVEVRTERCPSSVRVDGEPVAGGEPRLLARERLVAGVTLELAERVLLLVHLLPPTVGGARSERHGLVGASPALEKVRAAVDRVADLDVTVLLRGESGTGKELAARAVHRASGRRREPFVAVNLGALPPALAAAEIFGSVKGAFTGAVAAQSGYLRAARRGTLFLDEVGEAPPEIQAMLLRALETGEYFPVGSQRPEHFEARLVAATDSDLERRVREGDFKEPLLHRLASYEIWLPPLRERLDDLGRLFLHFAGLELTAMGRPGLPESEDPDAPPWCPTALMARWARQPWRGNVRELRNRVRQAVIDSRGEAQLRVGPAPDRRIEPVASGSRDAGSPGRRPMELGEEELEEALKESSFEPAAAARRLGISRPSLYNRIRAHPTLRTAEDVSEDELAEVLRGCDGDVKAAAHQLQVSARGLRRRLS